MILTLCIRSRGRQGRDGLDKQYYIQPKLSVGDSAYMRIFIAQPANVNYI